MFSRGKKKTTTKQNTGEIKVLDFTDKAVWIYSLNKFPGEGFEFAGGCCCCQKQIQTLPRQHVTQNPQEALGGFWMVSIHCLMNTEWRKRSTDEDQRYWCNVLPVEHGCFNFLLYTAIHAMSWWFTFRIFVTVGSALRMRPGFGWMFAFSAVFSRGANSLSSFLN